MMMEFKGFSSIMVPATYSETENLLDEVQLNRSLCRTMTKPVLSSDMFPAKTITKKH